MSTRLPSLLSSLALVSIAGSCTNKDPVTLNISGTGFASELEGASFKVGVVDVDGKKVVDTATGQVTNGKITASLVVDADTTYRADIFIDADEDGKCQFGIDSVYALDIHNVPGGTTHTATIDPTLVDSRGCLAWGGSTLHATLTNFPDHGTIYEAALIRTDGHGNDLVPPLARTRGSVNGNTITLDFPGAIVPTWFYEVDIYIDNQGNAHCDSADGIYKKVSTALPGGQTDGLTGDTVPVTIDAQVPTNQGNCTAFNQ